MLYTADVGTLTVGDIEFSNSGENKIISGSLALAESLIASELSADELDVTVYVKTRTTAEALQIMETGTDVTYTCGDFSSRFRLVNVERVAKWDYRITCTSEIGYLDYGTKHYGGVYDGQDLAQSGAAAVIADVIGGAFTYSVTGFSDVRLYGWLPIASRRENLQQVLFAIGGNITKDAGGDVVISPLPDTVASDLDKSRIFLGGKVTYPVGASAVRVTEHSYVPGQEEKEIYSGEVISASLTSPQGESLTGQLIEFSEPYRALRCEGSEILESGTNYAILSPAPDATLYGTGYVHNQKVVTVYAEDSAGGDYIPEVKGCTLVSLANSTNVAQRVLAYYSGFKRVEQDFAVADERPGDRVTLYDPYGEKSGGYIRSLDLTLGALLRGKAVFETGYIPSGIGNNFKNVMVVDQSGTVTLPDTNRVRLVLIGGGSGGYGGYPGEEGKQPSQGSSSTSSYEAEKQTDGAAYVDYQKYAPASSWMMQPSAYLYPTWADPEDQEPRISGISMSQYAERNPDLVPDPSRVSASAAKRAGYGYLKTSNSTYIEVQGYGHTSQSGTVCNYQNWKTVKVSRSYGTNWASYSSLTPGGAGGDGGNGGMGGKIYIADVEITPGGTVTVSLGTGGAGGYPADDPDHDPVGADGTATTVTIGGDVISSENGQVYPEGYIDVISGVRYAAMGDTGTPGGAGGATESYTIVYPGENVGEYHGGSVTGSGEANPSGSGGGASATADGSPGTTAASGHRGAGGAGASANSAPTAPATAGQGGTGGYGGGGGGNAAGWNPTGSTYHVASPAPGGNGGPGGAGAPGVVLIFYGDPVPEVPADALKDWYRQVMIDEDGNTVTVTGGYRSKYSGWQIDDFIGEVLNG